MKRKNQRALFAPEVIQTSAMDCGPASLKCLLEGFGRSISYGRLREACQTDVDGTSIDTLEEIAQQIGLEASQVIVPIDHVFLDASHLLPAIVVVNIGNRVPHFVVVWRRHGRFVQIMDPAIGRRWLTLRKFLEEIYVHSMLVPEDLWRQWADSEGFLDPLDKRLRELGLSTRTRSSLINQGLDDPTFHSLAALDATVRMAKSLVTSGGINRGTQAENLVMSFSEENPKKLPLPEMFWSVLPAPAEQNAQNGTAQVIMRGAVLIKVRGIKPRPHRWEQKNDRDSITEAQPPIPSELKAALEETRPKPLRELLRLIGKDSLLAPSVVLWGAIAGACAVVFQALLFRGLLDLPLILQPPHQRLFASGALIAFLMILLIMDIPVRSTLLRLGRHLDGRLRIAFLEKIPRLGDRYFHSRLTSDMAERCHALTALRSVPELGARLIRSGTALICTTIGIAWLDPQATILAIIVAALSVALPIASQRILAERDLRIRTHSGALTRFYLDALLGIVTIRAHGAGRSLRREHESLLIEWVRSSFSFLRTSVVIHALLALSGMALAGILLIAHLSRSDESNMVLLLVYWSLQIPALGAEVASVALSYPSARNVFLRLAEPLGALEESEIDDQNPLPEPPDEQLNRPTGAILTFRNVSVRTGGHRILENIDLDLPSGTHVAIVGPSGAGKSSLAGLLLGWHKPSSGLVSVDGNPLDSHILDRLRSETAWVDPSVQLWNRTFLENMTYGNDLDHQPPMAEVIDGANLKPLLETLPEGLQTELGEGGALVSGGEGQRIRFGRALFRKKARLVILDEAFRGLDREKRRDLLAHARSYWSYATLICISHDIAATLDFDHLFVMDQGKIIEQGHPRKLARNTTSRYHELLKKEAQMTEGLWAGVNWRQMWLEDGQITEREPLNMNEMNEMNEMNKNER